MFISGVTTFFIIVAISIVAWLIIIFSLKLYFSFRRSHQPKTTIAFFHPNVDQFGGGEKVFWHLFDVVAGLVKNDSRVEVVVYSFPSSKENLQTFEGLIGYATVCTNLLKLLLIFY
jgi:hypothetical protein